ncbi:hypothetical protein MHH74_06170 [Bacillus sp. FSL M7-0996]|uniref:hypothetical protein n=1 Tax=Bacillus sp. FSL M7-0996 TaxID=2921538 RepID=UPI0030F6ED31
MSVIEQEKLEEFYRNEIRSILAKVQMSFGNEQMYNYDLLEKHTELENEFKKIENQVNTYEEILNIYNRTKLLLV